VFFDSSQDQVNAIVVLAAVVTREGELSQIEVLGSSSAAGHLADDLLRLASDVKFSPALYGVSPVAVNDVWLLERTIVRGEVEGGGVVAAYCEVSGSAGILRTCPGWITEDLRPLACIISDGVVPYRRAMCQTVSRGRTV